MEKDTMSDEVLSQESSAASECGDAASGTEGVGCGKMLGRMTAEQYWEWRTTAAELRCAGMEKDLAKAQSQLLFKDADIMKLKASIHARSVVMNAEAKHAAAKSEYDSFRSKLEGQLGFSIDGKIVDEAFAVFEPQE